MLSVSGDALAGNVMPAHLFVTAPALLLVVVGWDSNDTTFTHQSSTALAMPTPPCASCDAHSYLDSVQFITSQGRLSPTYGGDGGAHPFELWSDDPIGGLGAVVSRRGWLVRITDTHTVSQVVVDEHVSRRSRANREFAVQNYVTHHNANVCQLVQYRQFAVLVAALATLALLWPVVAPLTVPFINLSTFRSHHVALRSTGVPPTSAVDGSGGTSAALGGLHHGYVHVQEGLVYTPEALAQGRVLESSRVETGSYVLRGTLMRQWLLVETGALFENATASRSAVANLGAPLCSHIAVHRAALCDTAAGRAAFYLEVSLGYLSSVVAPALTAVSSVPVAPLASMAVSTQPRFQDRMQSRLHRTYLSDSTIGILRKMPPAHKDVLVRSVSHGTNASPPADVCDLYVDLAVNPVLAYVIVLGVVIVVARAVEKIRLTYNVHSPHHPVYGALVPYIAQLRDGQHTDPGFQPAGLSPSLLHVLRSLEREIARSLTTHDAQGAGEDGDAQVRDGQATSASMAQYEGVRIIVTENWLLQFSPRGMEACKFINLQFGHRARLVSGRAFNLFVVHICRRCMLLRGKHHFLLFHCWSCVDLARCS